MIIENTNKVNTNQCNINPVEINREKNFRDFLVNHYFFHSPSQEHSNI